MTQERLRAIARTSEILVERGPRRSARAVQPPSADETVGEKTRRRLQEIGRSQGERLQERS